MNRDMEITCRPQHELVAFAGHRNVLFSMSNTKGNTRSVFGTAKTSELRGVLAARCGSYKRQIPEITRNWAAKNSDKVVGRDGSNSPAGQCCAVNLAFKNLRQ